MSTVSDKRQRIGTGEIVPRSYARTVAREEFCFALKRVAPEAFATIPDYGLVDEGRLDVFLTRHYEWMELYRAPLWWESYSAARTLRYDDPPDLWTHQELLYEGRDRHDDRSLALRAGMIATCSRLAI